MKQKLAHDAASDSHETVWKSYYVYVQKKCVGVDYNVSQYPLDIRRKRNHNHNGLIALIILFQRFNYIMSGRIKCGEWTEVTKEQNYVARFTGGKDCQRVNCEYFCT